MYETKPWIKYYGNVPESIDYPKTTMYEALVATSKKFPASIAWDFMGKTCTYANFVKEIDIFANALSANGLKKGDTITISMPTTPQGIICFYAANKLGAVASMIHPLSPPNEIEFYLNVSKSKMALTINAFYKSFSGIMQNTQCEKLILTTIPDYLPSIKGFLFNLTKGRKIATVPDDSRVLWWKDMMQADYPAIEKANMDTNDMAVILYSGGTTGVPKGIMLSNYNFISEGMQVAHWGGMDNTDSILAILPIFHGFGLGVCVNSAFMGGGKSILVPQFTPELVAKLIKKKKPTFIVGVPTLYEALTRNKDFQNADLKCLKGAFSGADHLPRIVKENFEGIVRSQGGEIQLREGYGLTEAVTAIMAMPLSEYREGSIGVPFSDMMIKIVQIGSIDEAKVGEEGEICIAGPAVMLGYLDNDEETANTLKKHADGHTWLHTGDIGYMDEDGFTYFKLRLKRMIKSSGMNVYPSQVEDIIRKHPDVEEACVIGVPDKKQVEKVKAFVVLKDKSKASPDFEKELMKHCQKDLIKWSCPREIEFRDELPLTLVGKVAYKKLEEEEIKKLKEAGEYTGE